MQSFAEKIKEQEAQAQKEGIATQGGGDWYKFVEGTNSFRVLTEPEMMFEDFRMGICYTDCGFEGGSKFLTYVLDRKDGKIKLAKLPYSIGTKIAGYENDTEFSLDFQGFPMPYDIRVIAKGAGTKEVKYQVDPNPNKRPVEQQTIEAMAKLKPTTEIIEKMKQKNKEKHVADGTWQANQDKKAQGLTSLKEARARGEAEGSEVDRGYEYPDAEDTDAIPF